MQAFKTLKIEKPTAAILIVTLNRPEVRNAINIEMMHDLLNLWREIAANPGSLRCIILTGMDPAFCAGADLKERRNMPLDIWKAQHDVLEAAMLAMVDCQLPIIAAVNGAAFGGGLELILACDFAYAARTALFAQSEVKIGIMPGAFGTQHLPRATGLKRAKELAFTAQSFSAEEAWQWNIINKVCESSELLPAVLEVAKKICDNAPLAVQQVKQAINMTQQVDIRSGFRFEMEAYNTLLLTQDREEGIRAFNEKRKPIFLGR